MKNIPWRVVIVLSVIAVAVVYILPTFSPAMWPHKKINLGLDLQGGMHLVLEVDTDKAVENAIERIAHELKTPLTAILSSSELMTENVIEENSIIIRLANNVRNSALSMNKRVAELIDLARLQIGQLDINPKPVDIEEIIIDVAAQSEIVFAAKDQTLTLMKFNQLPKVDVDREKVEQVLYNLLSNANKFSPTGSKIILSADTLKGKVIIKVEDSALVIPETEINKIFNPYYRSEDSTKRDKFPGLGLGLSISKKIIEMHQGEIWVESRTKRGNIFSFSLPVTQFDDKKN